MLLFVTLLKLTLVGTPLLQDIMLAALSGKHVSNMKVFHCLPWCAGAVNLDCCATKRQLTFAAAPDT